MLNDQLSDYQLLMKYCTPWI